MAIHPDDYPYLEELTRLQARVRSATNRVEAEAEARRAAHAAIEQAMHDYSRARSRAARRHLRACVHRVCQQFGLPNPFKMKNV